MTEWHDDQPIYRQLARLMLGRIITGSLGEGEPLPSVRQVASQEQINPLTVSRAYQTLMDDGLLEKRRGVGMFVAEGARDAALSSERRRFLDEEWPELKRRIELLGLNPRELLKGDPR